MRYKENIIKHVKMDQIGVSIGPISPIKSNIYLSNHVFLALQM